MNIIYKTDISESDTQLENTRCISLSATKENFGRIGELEKVKIQKQPKTKNRFAHVFWSEPALKDFKEARWNVGNQYELTLALSALSLACLKEMGQEVVLYTDSKGEELLRCLGYDKIYTIFDKVQIHNDFWAAGKAIALQNEPLDSCLIDNDLFLYDANLIDKIHNTPVIASNEESTKVYEPLLQFGQTYCKHLKGDTSKSTNAGITKIQDVALKIQYITAYFNGMQTFGNPNILNHIKRLGSGAYCVDLLVEQFNLHKICKLEYLIELAPEQKDTEGLTHLISFEKYLKVPQILDMLKEQFPSYYNKVITKWNELDFSVQVEDKKYSLIETKESGGE